MKISRSIELGVQSNTPRSSQASTSLKNATIEDVLRANKIVAKLKLQSVKPTLESIGNILAIRNFCLQ